MNNKYDFIYSLGRITGLISWIEEYVLNTKGMDAIKSISVKDCGVEIECHYSKIRDFIGRITENLNVQVDETEHLILFRYNGMLFFANK